MLSILAFVLSLLGAHPAAAQGCGPQNPNCIVPTAPVGTSNNQAASTEFVHNEIAGNIPLPNGQFFVGNMSNIATAVTLSGDCTSTNAGVITCTRINGITWPSSGTSGGVPYFSSTNSIASSAALVANRLVLGGGPGVAPATLGSLGTTTTVLHGNAGGAPSFASVANADMATMAANTVKCNSSTSTTTPVDCNYPVINVKDPAYGAVGDGSADDTTAIQNAINALPTTGGDVVFPPGNYKVTSTIGIGNGTSSTGSTRYGVTLRGVGTPHSQPFPGFSSAQPKITWAGGTSASVLKVAGPLQGWGIQNLSIDCASIASVTGIEVESAQFGDSKNLTLQNCFFSISSNTFAFFAPFSGGGANLDSISNMWTNITVNPSSAANAVGIFLSGISTGVSNTDLNTFTNIDMFLPGGVQTGIQLGVSDTNTFVNTHIYGGNASTFCVAFDYGTNSNFPGSNRFLGIDVGTCGGGTQFAVFGTPSVNAKPNYIYVNEGNGTVCPLIVNVACDGALSKVTNPGGNNVGTDVFGAWTAFTPTPVCGTATITTGSARRKTMGKTTFIEVDFTITALGTCTNALTWTAPNTAQSSGSLAGQEAGNSGKGVTCRFTGASSAVLGCEKADATNFAVNDRLFMSGVYENQ